MRPRAIVMLVLLAWLVILGLSTGFPLFYRLGYIISIGLFISYIWNYLNLWQVTVTAEKTSSRYLSPFCALTESPKLKRAIVNTDCKVVFIIFELFN